MRNGLKVLMKGWMKGKDREEDISDALTGKLNAQHLRHSASGSSSIVAPDKTEL